MYAHTLIKFLKMFPENTEVMVQTREGDLLSPVQMENIWQTNAWLDERSQMLEQPKLVITAFIEGRESYNYSNDQRGVLVKYIEKPTEPHHGN